MLVPIAASKALVFDLKECASSTEANVHCPEIWLQQLKMKNLYHADKAKNHRNP